MRRNGMLAALLVLCGVTAGAWEWTGIGSRILPRADLWLGPERVEFGRVPVGSREQRVVIATNHGAEDVVVSGITAAARNGVLRLPVWSKFCLSGPTVSMRCWSVLMLGSCRGHWPL